MKELGVILLLNVAIALVLLVVENRKTRLGLALSSLGVLGLLGGWFTAWLKLREAGFQPLPHSFEWVEIGARVLPFELGVFIDPIALVVHLAVVVFAVYLLLIDTSADYKGFASLNLSCALAILAAYSLTPWIMGFALVGLMGSNFLMIEKEESANASRHLWQSGMGLLLAFSGICVLTAFESALNWIEPPKWLPYRETTLGAWFCSFGLLVYLGSLGYSDGKGAVRILVGRLLPLMVVVTLFVRLEPYLRAYEVFPALGWLALATCFFYSLRGLFQSEPSQMVWTWLAGGGLLSIAAIAFAGADSAVLLLLGYAIAALSTWGVGANLTTKGAKSSVTSWSKAAIVIAALSSAGVIGFLVNAGLSRTFLKFTAGEMNPATFGALFGFVTVMVSIVIWKSAWRWISFKTVELHSWRIAISSLLLALGSIGLIWTGNLTGGVVVGLAEERVFHSIFDLFWSDRVGSVVEQDRDVTTAIWVLQIVLLLIIGVTYWTRAAWKKVENKDKGVSALVTRSYGLDQLVSRLYALGSAVSYRFEYFFVEKVWNDWVASRLGQWTQWFGRWTPRVDGFPSMTTVLRYATELPARGIQKLQNGDVQWYLFFALVMCIMTLISFIWSF